MFVTRNLTQAIALRSIGKPVAFAGDGKPGWKLDADGKIEMRDGNPVYIDAAGAELALGTDTVSRLNGEAKDNRIRAEKAEASLKEFEGLDAKAARTALDTVKDLKDGDLLKKGEVERVRLEISNTFQKQIDDLKAENGTLSGTIDSMSIGGHFKDSKWIADNIAVPRGMLQATFGKNFKREGDQIVAYDDAGNKIFSPTRGGELANFDEAMQKLVDGYADKDAILKGGNHRGTGNGGGGGANGGGRIVRRAEFEAMSPADSAKTAAAMAKGELTIAD